MCRMALTSNLFLSGKIVASSGSRVTSDDYTYIPFFLIIFAAATERTYSNVGTYVGSRRYNLGWQLFSFM